MNDFGSDCENALIGNIIVLFNRLPSTAIFFRLFLMWVLLQSIFRSHLHEHEMDTIYPNEVNEDTMIIGKTIK